MHRLPSSFLLVLLFTAHGDSQGQKSGIAQFWTDDYKVFDQIYGKTSDKHLYGVTLPPTISFDIPSAPKLAASEKFERYLPSVHDVSELTDDRYAKLFSKSLHDDKKKGSALQFISFSDFKPISAESDPETYKYLKHLEHDNEYKIDVKHFKDDKYGNDFRDKGYVSYKPYITKQLEEDTEERDAYKSIQDIIDAHEANGAKMKSHEPKEDEDDIKEKPTSKYNRGTKNINKVRQLNGNGIKPSCTSGRCRKRYAHAPVSRPYVRKIHYRYVRR